MKTQHPHAGQAQQAQPAWLARLQQGPQGDPRQPVVYGRYTFRHASTPAGQRPAPPPNNPLRRAPRGPSPGAAQQQPQTTARDERPLDHDPDDKDGQGRREQDFGSDLGGDKQQGFAERDDADDGARRRAFENVRVPQRRKAAPAAHVLARSGLAGAAALFVPPAPGTRLAMDRLQTLASVLMACALQADRRDPTKPAPSAVVLAAMQQHLVSQATAPAASLTLDDVKALLMSLPESPPPQPASDAERERIENRLLLLPLVLLSAGRKRTPSQRRQAIDRLQVLRNSPGLA